MQRPILIIEDDPDISESLKYNFEREGLPAITALTGEAGLSAALNERDDTETAAEISATDWRVLVRHRALNDALERIEDSDGNPVALRTLLASLHAHPPNRPPGPMDDLSEAGERRMWPHAQTVTYTLPDGGTGHYTEKGKR